MIEDFKEIGAIGLNVICQLEKLHLNLSHLWLLVKIHLANEDSTIVDFELPDYLVNGLERKSFLANGKITDAGVIFLSNLGKDGVELADLRKAVKKAKGAHNLLFIEWWNKYPSGNSWFDDEQHGNKHYSGSRSFKTKKDECEIKYLEAIFTPGITHQDMLDALDYEVTLKKVESRKTNTNKMTYMVNTYTYLFQKQYEGYIEMMKQDKNMQGKVKPKPEQTDFKTMIV